ncbi:MAG: NTPase [Candidatus Nitrosocaldaceae archaeon]|nr:MAG: NTPase [Candidatus Nitrosocaldaceae archaeon]
MLILITGEPGVGKTTILLKLFNMLKSYKVGGIIAKEIRSNGRIGFEFIDLSSNKRELLASIHGNGPRVGKYYINLEGCKFAADILKNANNYDIILVDELGPMEFKSKEFRDAAKMLLDVNKIRIVVIHKRLKDTIIDEYKRRANAIITVTKENRDNIPDYILKMIC